jgi:(2R)-ethylmalonyl-CoA mutase
VSAAVEEDVHVVGLSVLSGLAPAGGAGGAARACRRPGLDDVPVVVGGIIPDSDARRLREQGVARVFTPKDFGLTDIMGEVVDVVREAHGLETRQRSRG